VTLSQDNHSYKAGAFTGANRTGKIGFVQAANGGTLFLDEISELPLGMQAKLLRVLQEKEVIPIGSTQAEKVDVRIIAACNCSLAQRVIEGKFRQDLYYRINVVSLEIPPLRQRRSDIIVLAQHFLQQMNKKFNITKNFSPEALKLILTYPWPGNVRELQNFVERLAILYSNNTISIEEVKKELYWPNYLEPIANNNKLQERLEQFEKEIIKESLIKFDNNLYEAAKYLGIHRTTLIRKMRRYNL